MGTFITPPYVTVYNFRIPFSIYKHTYKYFAIAYLSNDNFSINMYNFEGA
jgi:hypothetical protein